MSFVQDREVRLCQPKSTTTNAELRSIMAFCVLTAADSPVHVIAGDYPGNEPETVDLTRPIRCYRNGNGDPNNIQGLVWVRDLSDAEFQTFFDYNDNPGA